MAVLATGLVIATAIFSVIAVNATSYKTVESDLARSEDAFSQNVTESDTDYVLDSMRQMGLEVLQDDTEVSVSARMKMSDFMFNPFMLVPQLIMWGFAPILLANLKMFVMQALMLNKMALSSAIFMTLRNIVFGPRPGHVVKYANYGYGHGHNKVYHYHRQS